MTPDDHEPDDFEFEFDPDDFDEDDFEEFAAELPQVPIPDDFKEDLTGEVFSNCSLLGPQQ